VLLTGCVVIPVDYYSAGSRHNLSEKAALSLQPGKMTKEEVLVLLGEPDYVSEDGQRLDYRWKRVKAIVVIVAGSGCCAGEIQRSKRLQVWFDANEYISHVDIVKGWGP
jgi:outer membrane protein assembly factor BamE (lipoprotein component of BamABCDE complex)